MGSLWFLMGRGGRRQRAKVRKFSIALVKGVCIECFHSRDQ